MEWIRNCQTPRVRLTESCSFLPPIGILDNPHSPAHSLSRHWMSCLNNNGLVIEVISTTVSIAPKTAVIRSAPGFGAAPHDATELGMHD